MTLQIELDPSTEARLRAAADKRGVAPEDLAGELLRENIPFARGTGILTSQNLEEFTREFTRGSEHLPVLPPEANNREFYYEGRG